MHRMVPYLAALAVTAVTFSAGPAAAIDLKVSVNIAAPPVVLAPPPMVVVTGTPVQVVPSASFNLFVYRNHYYSHHNGAWFLAVGPRAPWTAVAIEAVPKPVLAVPVKHYKIPPGHARKMEAQAGGWCPPGQAKKGRC